MRIAIAFAAAVIVNLFALGVLEWSLRQAHTPAGVVVVTQLPQAADPLYAHAQSGTRSRARL